MRKMLVGSIAATVIALATSMASAVPESSVDYTDNFGGGWSFTGCVVHNYYVATSTMVNGRPGPAGYRRYVNIGFVQFCLPN